MIRLVDYYLSKAPYNFQIGTPRDPNHRGGHIALEREEEAYRISQALKMHDIIPDFRPPNIIRIAPIALYNTYEELWKTVKILKDIIESREYLQLSKERGLIS